MTSSTAERPLLVLAPHVVLPPRNGADITLDELGKSFSRVLPHVDVVCATQVVRYEKGAITTRNAFAARARSRSEAGIRTILGKTHYHREKFLTGGFRRVAKHYLADSIYRVVLHSFLTTASLADPNDTRPHLVLSHNDEFRWFEDLAQQAPNILGRTVAKTSKQWLHRFLDKQPHRFVFLHLTDEDDAGWRHHAPDHRARVVPIGVSMRAPAPPLPPDARPSLLFVGALGVRMNLDALRHFAERYEPSLHAHFGANLQVTVAGSTPLPEVVNLCRTRGWELHRDVSEETLDTLFMQATFSLLPFAYATGAKLKLLKSLAYGVPFLATEAVQAQADVPITPCLVSSDPDAWVQRVAEVCSVGIATSARRRLQDVARVHSWDASTQRILEVLEDIQTGKL